VTVHGDGSAARDWMFVEDHCEALDRILHAPRASVMGQVINIGTGEHRSVHEVARAIHEAMGEPPKSPVQFIGDRPGQVFRHTCDRAKAEKLVGWQPRTAFEHGLERTIRWYRDNEAWWRSQIWMRHVPIVTPAGKKELH
jgi:dTDP-glucose 4,6-dehydratase